MIKNYSVPKAVESQIRRIKIFYPGKRLHRSDVDLFRDILLLGYCLVGDLLPFNETALRQYRGFLGASDISILKFAQSLKFFDSYLKNSLNESDLGTKRSLQSFKHSVKDANLYWGLMKPFEEVVELFFLKQDPHVFQILNTWINFPVRANLRSLDLIQESLVDYCQFEAQMTDWVYPEDTIQEMRDVMSEWLKDFTFEHFVPKHGPGSVAGHPGRLPVLYKHQLHEMDIRLNYFYSKDVNMSLNECFPSVSNKTLSRTSELVFVPKSLMKNRTISKEPLSLQYTQQGVQRALYRYFDDHAYLSERINLSNQELSKEAARFGSIRGEFDTLDLSNASDSVSLLLIKKVFVHTPIYRALICTRSDATLLPNGLVLKLNKFAPMGSALCFPVETLIFACICEVALRRCRSKSYYRVYGDDIVCARALTEGIKLILAQLHFELNVSKSFTGQYAHNFREACGGEYIDGVDVAPFRMSRWFKSYCDDNARKISSADTVQSYIAFANEALATGLTNVRRCILYLLEVRYDDYSSLMFVNDEAHLNTFDDGLTNWKLHKRFRLRAFGRSTCYQRVEYRCKSYTSKCDNQTLIDLRFDPRMDPATEDDIRYFEYFRSRVDANTYEGLQLNGLIVKSSAFNAFGLKPCEEADLFAFPPEIINVRSTRAVMHWTWADSWNN